MSHLRRFAAGGAASSAANAGGASFSISARDSLLLVATRAPHSRQPSCVELFTRHLLRLWEPLPYFPIPDTARALILSRCRGRQLARCEAYTDRNAAHKDHRDSGQRARRLLLLHRARLHCHPR